MKRKMSENENCSSILFCLLVVLEKVMKNTPGYI